MVQVWDESLFAITPEMAASGNWIATTFRGSLDYYNSKPPLHVWLVALSFKVLGPGLESLGHSGPVLATSYGFLYVHSGRSGNSDSLLTLLVLLTVVTLWAARDRPWRGVWLGVTVGLVIVAPWAAARWQVDQWRFLRGDVPPRLRRAPCCWWRRPSWWRWALRKASWPGTPTGCSTLGGGAERMRFSL